MPWWIALLNTVAALLSVVFAAITLARPNQFIPPTLRRQTDRFAAATYAVRAIPLGLAVVVVVWVAPAGIATALLLGVACVAQVGDLVLGVVHRVWGMAGGGRLGRRLPCGRGRGGCGSDGVKPVAASVYTIATIVCVETITREVSTRELRSQLSDVLGRAMYAGERIGVTRNGKLAAVVVGVEDLEALEAYEMDQDIAAYRRSKEEDDGTRISLAELRAELPS